jgi:hypothetical protein
VQSIKAACGNKSGDCVGATLDQDAAQTAFGEGRDDPARCDAFVLQWQAHSLYACWKRTSSHDAGNDNSAYAIAHKRACACGKAAPRVDYHANWAWPLHAAYSELGIIRNGCTDPDHNGVDQGAQLVQMIEPGLAVDIMRVPAGSGDASVD